MPGSKTGSMPLPLGMARAFNSNSECYSCTSRSTSLSLQISCCRAPHWQQALYQVPAQGGVPRLNLKQREGFKMHIPDAHIGVNTLWSYHLLCKLPTCCSWDGGKVFSPLTDWSVVDASLCTCRAEMGRVIRADDLCRGCLLHILLHSRNKPWTHQSCIGEHM